MFTNISNKILGSKLKTISALSLMGVSGTAMPISIAAADSSILKKAKESLAPIKLMLDKVPELWNRHIKTAGETTYSQWETSFADVKDKFETEKIKKPFEEIASTGQTISGYSSYLTKDNFETYNHAAFSMSAMINALLKFIPQIIANSAKLAINPERGEQLLDIEKAITFGKNENFLKVMKGFMDLDMNKMTSSTATGIMNILGGVEMTKINSFLTKVNNNLEKATEQEKKDVNELSKAIFVGTEQIKKIPDTLQKLITNVETQSSQLENMDGLGKELISKFQEVLNQIKEKFPNSSN